MFFTESQDLRELPLHPGLTIDGIDCRHRWCAMQTWQRLTTHLAHTEEPGPELPETILCRSVHIAKHLGCPGREIKCIYAVSRWWGYSTNLSLPDDTGMHVEADATWVWNTHTEDMSTSTFDDKEWCNLSNKDEPISYRDTFCSLMRHNGKLPMRMKEISMQAQSMGSYPSHSNTSWSKSHTFEACLSLKRDSMQIIQPRCAWFVRASRKNLVSTTLRHTPLLHAWNLLGLFCTLSVPWLGNTSDGHQKQLFLHGNLEEEVYIGTTQGHEGTRKEDWVCYCTRLYTASCKLRCAWNIHLTLCHVGEGRAHRADHCIYMHNTPSGSSTSLSTLNDMAATASLQRIGNGQAQEQTQEGF